MSIVLIISLVFLNFIQSSFEFVAPSPAFDFIDWANDQLNKNDSAQPIKVESFMGEECYRPCSEKASRVCYFKFVLEHYHAMGPACGDCCNGDAVACLQSQCITADGIDRGVMSINRKIPGPFLHVCKNDLVVVDVVNAMHGAATTIHWHGFHMRETPHMDGVPYITQCPIDFGQSFRYSFWATEPGTQFYHSHSGHHKVNGHHGAIIVREPNDPHAVEYDYDLKEHTVLVSDWMHDYGEMYTPGLVNAPGGISPTSIIINGKGQFRRNGIVARNLPGEVFKVMADKNYRFRFINSASHVCPVQIQIEKHELKVIATDSYATKPVIVDTLISTSGERYDFVVRTNSELLKSGNEDGAFCIKVRLLGICGRSNIYSYGILKYDTNHNLTNIDYVNSVEQIQRCENVTFSNGIVLNHPNSTCYTPDTPDLCSADLEALDYDADLIESKPDVEYDVSFNNYPLSFDEVFGHGIYEHFMSPRNGSLLTAALNKISFTFPPISLLTQPNDLREDLFCNQTTLPQHCEGKRFCHCTHRIKIPLGAKVQMNFFDETASINALNHPFHLHGVGFYVTGMGQIKKGSSIVQANALIFHSMHDAPKMRTGARSDLTYASTIPMPQGHRPPLMDTASIPSKGVTIIKFRANNPGFWLLHCHFEYHMAVGMGLVFQVGEPTDFVKAPANFPKCNNYTPDIDETVIKYKNLLP